MTLGTRTVLITGSTDGVGRRVAEQLARPDINVLIHGRDHSRAETLLAAIGKAGGHAQFYPADVAALSQVRTLAETITRDHGQLDLLINNAGIGIGSNPNLRQTSADGYELRFAVNYLAGFLLTHLLLPALKSAPSARVVNVVSVGQQAIDFSDVMLARGYSGRRAYCQSKLAQIMFTFDLAEAHKGSNLTVTCLHPASYMDTAMVRGDGIAPMSSVDEGADAILHMALSDAMEGQSGLYFEGLRPARAQAQAYDATARERLRSISAKLTGLPVLA